MKNIPVLGPINQCQICDSKRLELILALGHQPPVHGHKTKEELKNPEIKYPLNLQRCADCLLVQLDYAVDPKIIFPPNYPYHSGTTNMLVRNFRSLANLAIEKYNLTQKNLIIDIGSNDGSLLKGFQEKGMRVLGIEPTDVAKFAIAINKIPTIQKFFSEKVARTVLKKYGPASVITATNIFAHINNLSEFIKGIKILLKKNGVFISESQYLMDIVQKLEIDTIYDEHLRYYSLKPMQKLFSLVGMSLVDAERISAAGGSIRVYAMKDKNKPMSDRVKQLINEEEKFGLYNKKKLLEFANQAIKAKHDLVALLINCKKIGGRIAGLGAPGRSNTLLNFTKIDTHLLDYIGERNTSPKIGLFSPGMHFPIVDEIKLIKDQPEFILVLSWHIGEELMKKIRQSGYKGKFIIPLPEPRVVTEI